MAHAIRLVVDQDGARALGLAPHDIAETLQTLVFGLPVTEMRDGTDLVQVVARAVPEERLEVVGLADPTAASRDGLCRSHRWPGSSRWPKSRFSGGATASW